MEYFDGKDLHSIVKESGKVNVIDTLKIMIPISDCLNYAHGKGIIHRDIKSSNIFVTTDGKPVLTDFGIAHATSGTKLTQTGTVIGTPEYMSPEQAEGKVIDERSDLYSLGVVMYESLTACLPFKGENPISTIYKIINEKPPTIRTIVEKIPVEVESVVSLLLSKKKEDRYRNGEHLSQVLSEILNKLINQPAKDFGGSKRTDEKIEIALPKTPTFGRKISPELTADNKVKPSPTPQKHIKKSVTVENKTEDKKISVGETRPQQKPTSEINDNIFESVDIKNKKSTSSEMVALYSVFYSNSCIHCLACIFN